MRILCCLLLALFSSFGCTSSTDAGLDVGGSDAGCFPVAHVCVTDESGAPGVGTTVTAGLDATSPPSQGRTGADGCIDLDLTEGTWQIRAATDSMCVSMNSTVVVPACGTVDVALVTDLCAG